jgi:hypothetical protein
VFFWDILNSRNISYLQGLPTIRHWAPREKPDGLALRNGSTQHDLHGHYHVRGDDPNNARYFNPETGEGENQTFKVPCHFVNDTLALCGNSKLVLVQIVDCFGDMLNCVPPRKVNSQNFDWEVHVQKPMSQDQRDQWEILEIEVLKCHIIDAINANQTAMHAIVCGRNPCKYWSDHFSKAYQLAISHCTNRTKKRTEEHRKIGNVSFLPRPF